VVGRVDYDQRLHRAYRAGRTLSAGTGRLWMQALASRLGGTPAPVTILDLGAGTGRFSAMLADAFDACVVAVEPSAKMRAEAARGAPHPRVTYHDGSAEAIPAGAAEFDFAFLSMVVHHVSDLPACARELHRVLRPSGLVFIRSVFSGRLDSIRHYEFFPSARAIDEERLPTVERVCAAFAAAGFELVALDTVEQEIDASLRAHYERLTLRALSTLELISDAEFEAGLARMRCAVDCETAPAPVWERVDLLTLRRSG
jgi:ubiquinone/menaquinone biosynthesis C-methylase UbiE